MYSEQLKLSEENRGQQAAGNLAYDVLERIEQLMPAGAVKSAETGCGRSTILFSNLVTSLTSFCLDDQMEQGSSVMYCRQSELFQPDRVQFVFGPTQQTLPGYAHDGKYDCVLIDGPHGYPFPDIEYFHFYPLVRPGGLLIIDDVQIASIGRMADILQEDAMWEFVEMARTTAIFRRTSNPAFTTTGDDWWKQQYNQRRADRDNPFRLDDGLMQEPFAVKVQYFYQRLAFREKVYWFKVRLKRLLGM